MNAERLKTLAEAYGADPRRWPEAERARAVDFMKADSARAERILFEARQLDLALDASTSPRATHELREQVIAMAAGAGLRPRRRGAAFGVWPAGRLAWASGAGWAAACAAGVMFGMGATSHLVANAEADAVLYQASFEAVDDTEVLG